MTTTTDVFGYYSFFDVPVGNYIVKQTAISGYDISLGQGGISVTMNPNSVVGDVDFGNCEKCCAEPDELTNIVLSSLGATSIICDDSDGISIVSPNLLDCQYISRILWGDGTFDNLLPGDPIPNHVYTSNGVFVISIEVTSATPSGLVCQIDVVDIPLVYKNCVISAVNDDLSTPRMKAFPIPATNTLNIELDENIKGSSVKIYNTSGLLLFEKQIDKNVLNFSIDIDLLIPGVYYLRLVENITNRQLESRFIKI